MVPASVVSLLLLVVTNAWIQSAHAQEISLQFRTNTGDPSIQCRRFFAVNPDTNQVIDEAGSVCLVLVPTDPGSLTVSYVTEGDWVMQSTAAWFGSDLQDLPTNRDAEPQLNDFDFTTDNGNNIGNAVTQSSFIVPLADVAPVGEEGNTIDFADTNDGGNGGCTEAGQSSSILGVAAAELLRLVDGEEEEAIGWADGLVPADPEDDLWALFNFTLDCVSPVDAPSTAPPVVTPVPAPTPGVLPQTPFPTFPPVPPPVSPGLLADGALCDDAFDCQSGGCSMMGFCLVSFGNACFEAADCASGACLQGVCGICDASGNSPLDADLVERSRVAGLLSDRLGQGPFTTTPVTLEFGNVYNQGSNDLSMVAKVDGVCYGIFAPTETQDLSSFGTTPLTAFQQTCQVHERAYQAYFSPDRQLFELRLAQCASTCVSQDLDDALDFSDTPILTIQLDVNACPIVLAGHGLGGAAAVVGSMVLLDLSPQVITLGAPRTTSANCPLMRRNIASSKHTRYINLGFVESYNTFLFDPVPQLGDGGTLVHYGTPVVLDVAEAVVLELDNDTTRASVYSTNQTADTNSPAQLSAYNDRLEALYAEPCFPVPAASAWGNGHWCDQNDICTSERCRAFLSLGAGSSVGVCAQKLQGGSACTDNNDCASNGCNGGICSALAGNNNVPPPATTPPGSGGGGTVPPAPDNGDGGTGNLGNCALCSIGTECRSGVCVTFEIPGGSSSVCAETPEGTMSNGCFCFGNNNDQCTEGRCEADASGSLSICISPLAPCQSCDEDSDCISGNCETGVCGLQSGGLPDTCGGDGTDPNSPIPDDELPDGELPVCAAVACEEDDDCDSGFCRVTAGVSTCSESQLSTQIVPTLHFFFVSSFCLQCRREPVPKLRKEPWAMAVNAILQKLVLALTTIACVITLCY